MKDQLGREIDYVRIAITDNCNLRCVYCMDEKEQNFLKESYKLSNEEIIRVVDACAKLGIKKVRLTGGEPLVRKGIEELVASIHQVEGIQEIYMTTNGILLGEKVEKLAANGLTGVNISLDTLQEERFQKITRGRGLQKVLEAIDYCLKLQLKVKINTVMIEGWNLDEILDFVAFTKKKKVDVRFIELMPIGKASGHKGITTEQIKERIRQVYPKYQEIKKDTMSGPATYIQIEGAQGRIGFISPMSSCFCETCNRIRITPEGFIKRCLHYDYGVSLRDAIRQGVTDEELMQIIQNNIYEKPEKHQFGVTAEHKDERNMNQIGG